MRMLVVLTALLLAAGVGLAQGAADRQDRVVLEVIPLKYLDAATVVAIFGGTIIPNYSAPRMMPMGPRGGYGGNYGYSRAGAGIGGSYTTPRNYGGYGGGYGYTAQPDSGYGGPSWYGHGYGR